MLDRYSNTPTDIMLDRAILSNATTMFSKKVCGIAETINLFFSKIREQKNIYSIVSDKAFNLNKKLSEFSEYSQPLLTDLENIRLGHIELLFIMKRKLQELAINFIGCEGERLLSLLINSESLEEEKEEKLQLLIELSQHVACVQSDYQHYISSVIEKSMEEAKREVERLIIDKEILTTNLNKLCQLEAEVVKKRKALVCVFQELSTTNRRDSNSSDKERVSTTYESTGNSSRNSQNSIMQSSAIQMSGVSSTLFASQDNQIDKSVVLSPKNKESLSPCCCVIS